MTDTPHGDIPCPGDCNRDWWAAEQAATAERDRWSALPPEDRIGDQALDQALDHAIVDHDTPFHPGQPVWCATIPRTNDRGEILPGKPVHRGCTDDIRHALTEIRDLAGELIPGALNTPRDVDTDESKATKAAASQPSPSAAWDTADALIRWAVALEDTLRERLGDPPGARIRPLVVTTADGEHHPIGERELPRRLGHAIGYLTGNLTALLSGPDAERVGKQILHQHRLLRRQVGWTKLVHRLPGSCLVCDRKGLQREDGEEIVTCRACGAAWSWDTYELLAKAYADDVRKRGVGA